METIDVLVATYNGEKYLKEQLDSILNQTYKNIRVIISDDKSTDSTPNILKEYEKKDDRIIVYLNEKNVGYIKNFEFLLTKVENEIYMLSDQDDFWLEEKIEKTYETLKKEDADLVYGDLEVVDKDLNTIYDSFAKYLKIYNKAVKYNDYRAEFLYNCVTGCTLMSKKKYIKDIVPMPNESKYVAHDHYIALVVAMSGKIYFMKEKYIKYRQHGNNQIGTEKTSHKFTEFNMVRDLFINVQIAHLEAYIKYGKTFPEEIRNFSIEALDYFNGIKDKKHFNFKGLNTFHKLYRYDRLSYYLFNFVIMNMPLIAKIGFYIRLFVLKLFKKR